MNLTFQTGRIATEPRCPVHGRMSLDFPVDKWICHGWDGEGCDHVVRMEDMDWIPAENIRVEGVQWHL